MRRIAIACTALALVAAVAASPAHAQDFDLNPQLTQEQFTTLADDLGSILRFRQLGDPATLGRGDADVSLLFLNTSRDDLRFPQVVGRFGVTDRVALGVWGGVNAPRNYGVAGFETNVALLKQDRRWPVSVSVRPSVGTVVGPSDLWIGTASIDVAVSRGVGPLLPYAGVATTGTLAKERRDDLTLEEAATSRNVSYAGVSYQWRALVAAAEVEKGADTTYAFRFGTRF